MASTSHSKQSADGGQGRFFIGGYSTRITKGMSRWDRCLVRVIGNTGRRKISGPLGGFRSLPLRIAVIQAMFGSTLLAEISDSEIAVLVESAFALQAEIAAGQRVHAVGGADELTVQANFNL